MTKIAALVLAAGASKRFGDDDKLLANVNGAPIISHTLNRIKGVSFSQKLIVMDPLRPALRDVCDVEGFTLIENTVAAQGMGTSIAAGVAAIKDAEAVMVYLGDMPFITPDTITSLIEGLEHNPGKTIVAPFYEGQRGHPILFRKVHFGALRELNEDRGAAGIINANDTELLRLEIKDRGVVLDIDAPSDLGNF